MEFGFGAVTYTKAVNSEGEQVTRISRYDTEGARRPNVIDFDGHFDHEPGRCVFSHDGLRLFIGLKTGGVAMIDFFDEKVYYLEKESKSPIIHMKLSFDGRFLIFATEKKVWHYTVLGDDGKINKNFFYSELKQATITDNEVITDVFFFNGNRPDLFLVLIDNGRLLRLIIKKSDLFSPHIDLGFGKNVTFFSVQGIPEDAGFTSMIYYGVQEENDGKITYKIFIDILRYVDYRNAFEIYLKYTPLTSDVKPEGLLQYDGYNEPVTLKSADGLYIIDRFYDLQVNLKHNLNNNFVFSERANAYISLSSDLEDTAFVAFNYDHETDRLVQKKYAGESPALAVGIIPFYEKIVFSENDNTKPRKLVITPTGQLFLNFGMTTVKKGIITHNTKSKSDSHIRKLNLIFNNQNEIVWFHARAPNGTSDLIPTHMIISAFKERAKYKNLPPAYSLSYLNMHLHLKIQGTLQTVLINMDGDVHIEGTTHHPKPINVWNIDSHTVISQKGTQITLKYDDVDTKKNYTFTTLHENDANILAEYLSIVRHYITYPSRQSDVLDFNDIKTRYKLDLAQSVLMLAKYKLIPDITRVIGEYM
jgi:hypothetical protein